MNVVICNASMPLLKKEPWVIKEAKLETSEATFPVKKLKLMSFETSNKSKFKTFALQF